MATVSYPGVYVEEVPSGVHTITGVATSIAAFFGRSAKGPVDKAVRILSLSDFNRTFGGSHAASDLAQSVRQFFANGGTDCYVVRLARGAEKADVTLRDLADDRNVLTIAAKSAGVWGNALRLRIDYDTPNPDATFNLHVFYEEGGRAVSEEHFTNLSMVPGSARFAPVLVSQSSGLVDIALHQDIRNADDPMLFSDAVNSPAVTPAGYSQSRRPFVTEPLDVFCTELTDLLRASGALEINVNGEGYQALDLATIDITGAADLATVANQITEHINPQLHPGTSIICQWDEIGNAGSNRHVLRITSASERYTSVHIRRARQQDLAGPMMFGLDQGGIEIERYSNMRPVPNGTVFMGGSSPGDFTAGIDFLAGQRLDALNGLTIAGSPLVPVDVVTSGMAPDNLWYQQPGGGTDGVRERLRLIADAVTGDPSVPWRGEVWGYHLVFVKAEGSVNDSAVVTLAGAAGESTRTQLANGFTANVRRYSLGNIGTGTYQSLSTDPIPNYPGTRGNDGEAPQVGEYLGRESIQTGFHALDRVDLFNLMVLPGDRDVAEATFMQIIGPASIYCQQKRAFLLIDGPASWTRNHRPIATRLEVDALRRLVESDHAAVFYPGIEYSDIGLRKTMGPAGAIAGLMARIDSTRGVWKAPAGIEANLRGLLDLQVDLTDAENGVFNKLGVNCLRKFPGGFVNWGARTLAGSDDEGSEWKYIPIRRLALFLEESLYRGTKWVVFEPNDEPLWAQIRLNLSAFMMSLFRRGAFQGSTPDQAFFVKCDSETTTQDDRNQGIVNIEVGFAPLKPAEFVIIRIQQMAGALG